MRRRHALLAGPAMLVPAVGTALIARPARAQPVLRFYTAGAGSAFLPYGQGMAAFLARQGITVEVRQSAGSLENLRAVEDDAAAIGTAFLGSAWDALRGTAAAGGHRHREVRALFPMYETSFQWAALASRNLHEFRQLEGKKVGVGPFRGPAHSFFEAAMTTAGIRAEALGGDPAALVDALVEGRIDALWQGAITPIPSILAAQARAPVTVAGLPESTALAVTRRLPFLAPTSLPPGTYAGQAAPIHSFAAWNFVVGNAALAEEAAHALTRAALSAADPAAEINPSAAATRAANAVNNHVVPFHPGAARYYAEAGVVLPNI